MCTLSHVRVINGVWCYKLNGMYSDIPVASINGCYVIHWCISPVKARFDFTSLLLAILKIYFVYCNKVL